MALGGVPIGTQVAVQCWGFFLRSGVPKILPPSPPLSGHAGHSRGATAATADQGSGHSCFLEAGPGPFCEAPLPSSLCSNSGSDPGTWSRPAFLFLFSWERG